MSSRPTLVVFAKEVVDNLRDRRTLAAALLYPLLGPLLLVGLLSVVAKSATRQAEERLDLPVIGVEHAPSLVAFLEQNNTRTVPPPDDPRRAVKEGEVDLVLVIPETYGREFTNGRPAPVRLILDDSRQSSEIAIRRVQNLLQSYSRSIGTLRLLARGVDPLVTQAIAVETESVATAQSQAARFLAIAPYFIIFSIFIGGMYLAIDATAGERERTSLEPLLTTPATRTSIVVGKYLATLLFTAVAVVETLVGFFVVFNQVPLEEYLGVRYSMGVATLAGIFLITVPMMFLAAALQMLIATFARSFKEAQNLLSILPLAPALPGLFLVFLPVKPAMWMMAIPTFGQQIVINLLMRGQEIDSLQVAVSAGVTTLVAGLLVALTVRFYQGERLLR